MRHRAAGKVRVKNCPERPHRPGPAPVDDRPGGGQLLGEPGRELSVAEVGLGVRQVAGGALVEGDELLQLGAGEALDPGARPVGQLLQAASTSGCTGPGTGRCPSVGYRSQGAGTGGAGCHARGGCSRRADRGTGFPGLRPGHRRAHPGSRADRGLHCSSGSWSASTDGGLGTAGFVVDLVVLTVIIFGYPIIWESLWRGRTPGKAALGCGS